MINNIVIPIPIYTHGGGNINDETLPIVISFFAAWYILAFVVWLVDYIMRGCKDRYEWRIFLNDEKKLPMVSGISVACLTSFACILCLASFIHKLIA